MPKEGGDGLSLNNRKEGETPITTQPKTTEHNKRRKERREGKINKSDHREAVEREREVESQRKRRLNKRQGKARGREAAIILEDQQERRGSCLYDMPTIWMPCMGRVIWKLRNGVLILEELILEDWETKAARGLNHNLEGAVVP